MSENGTNKTVTKPKTEMLWDITAGEIVPIQMANLDGYTLRVEGDIEITREVAKEYGGDPLSKSDISLSLNGVEKQVLAYALQLVGFFSPSMGEVARVLFTRSKELNDEFLASVPTKAQERYKQAYNVVYMRRAFERMGIGEMNLPASMESFEGLFSDDGKAV